MFVDGQIKYLGWIRGTVMEYDKFKGYLVQFPDDVDWIPSLRSKDVRILEQRFVLALCQKGLIMRVTTLANDLPIVEIPRILDILYKQTNGTTQRNNNPNENFVRKTQKSQPDIPIHPTVRIRKTTMNLEDKTMNN